jgi:hypothetical protein
MLEYAKRIALIAAVTASLAACGSQSNTGQPGADAPNPGVSQPANGGNGSPNAGSGNGSSASAPTTTIPGPNGATCGAFLSKPSAQQVIDSTRVFAGKFWDEHPELQKLNKMTREQYVDAYLNGSYMSQGAKSSIVDILNAAPADGPAHFGRYLCDTVYESSDDMRGMEIGGALPDATANLWAGLLVCQRLEIWSPTYDPNVMFVKNIDKMLCPQIPVR